MSTINIFALVFFIVAVWAFMVSTLMPPDDYRLVWIDLMASACMVSSFALWAGSEIATQIATQVFH